MADQAQAIAALQATLTAMQQQVASLQVQLDTLRERGPTMRAQTRCPSCGCRKILHATEVPDATVAGYQPATLAISSRWKGLSETPRGQLQAYACTQCGLLEWYVPEISEVAIDGDKIRLINAEVPAETGGPYRSS